MFACLISTVLAAHPLEFASTPPPDQVSIGRALYRQGVGIDRALMDDRNVLGTWFDGRIRRAVDTATWLSPELTARWLGYVAERDVLTPDELAKRWQAASAKLNGHVTFIVRLAAFPRLDPFDLGNGALPQPETLKGVKFRLSFPSTVLHDQPGYTLSDGRLASSGAVQPPFEFEKENPGDVMGKPFYGFTPYAPLYMGAGEAESKDDGIPLGDYYGAVYVAQFPLSPSMSRATELELDVQLSSKREVAIFTLVKTPPAEPKRRRDDDWG